MIKLTRLSGTVFLLNVDLIERMDATPDTVITLTDGKKYVVAESLEAIRREVVLYRAEIIAAASGYDGLFGAPGSEPIPTPHLSAVRTLPDGPTDLSDARGGEPS